MNLSFPTFYNKFGVRQFQQLIDPRTFPVALLQLPLESALHYLDFDGVTQGPSAGDPLFKDVRHQIPVITIQHLETVLGQPRPVSFNLAQNLQTYFHQNRHLRKIADSSVTSADRQTPVVYNYALLARMYKYFQSPYANYYRVLNQFASFCQTLSTELKNNRNHFVFFDAPKALPGLAQLNQASSENGVGLGLLKFFSEPEAVLLLELWKFIMNPRTVDEKNPSTNSIFLKVPEDRMHLVNFVFTENGRWTVLNLGYLNGMRRRPKKEVDPGPLVMDSKVHLEPLQVAKRLLRFFMSVSELRSLAIVTGSDEEKQPAAATDDAFTDLDAPDVSTKDVDVGTEPVVADQTAQSPEVDLGGQESVETMDPAMLESYLAAQDAAVDAALQQIDVIINRTREQQEADRPTLEKVMFASDLVSPHDAIERKCDALVEAGVMTAAENRRMQTLSGRYRTIQTRSGETLEDFVKVDPAVVAIKPEDVPQMADSSAVLDKRMLKSSLSVFDSRYVEKVLDRDVAGMVLGIQNSGIAVTNMVVERNENILGQYDDYTVRITPIEGMPSTLRFKLPVLDKEGVFVSNGVPYRLRKQRVDLPIRKVAPNRVSLSSYYGKTFVIRGRLAANDYGRWLKNRVTAAVLTPNARITNLVLSDVSNYQMPAARAYTVLSSFISTVTVDGHVFNFDLPKLQASLNLKNRLKDGSVLVGQGSDQAPIFIRPNGTLYRNNGGLIEMGTFEDVFELALETAPLEYATLKVWGKDIPVGVVLGAMMGLQNLIELLNVNPRVVNAGDKARLLPDEVAIVFNDQTLVFKRSQHLACLILGGFSEFARQLKTFSVYSFDSRGVYQNLLENAGMNVKYMRELDLMAAMFVDPITKEVLESIHEPTTFKGLVLRACQMLTVDHHPDAMDPNYSRIRGYERIPGAVYAETIASLRTHNGKPGKRSAQVEMNPFAIWQRITEDPAKMQVQEINPIKALKETESATYAGVGGRMKRAMTCSTRTYHQNDMGIVSESTVDNSDVGVNINLVANPLFTSLRGTHSAFDMAVDGPTSLLSTSALLAPSSDKDDPKRVNFIAIQQDHAVACDGYHQFSVRTGYDSVIPQRTGEFFSVVAKQAGVVRSVKSEGLIVDYEDGTATGYPLGRRFGNAAGLTLAHLIVTPLKAGDKFTPGDAICYHNGFFEPDFFNKRRIVLKNAVELTTALLEIPDTFEDSSTISLSASQKLTTEISKVKVVQLKFDQKISQLVQVGQTVEADTVLCFIEDAVTANNALFTNDNLETLKAVSAQTPKAKVKGVVERIEVFYHGDKQDMSETVLALADQGDADLKRRANAHAGKVFTGQVDGGFRIDANPLQMDMMAVRIYITSRVPSGVGDKGVFANQMKTVHGRVMEVPPVTEDGEVVDALFGMKSIEARIVHSPVIIGTTAQLLHWGGKRAADIYRGKK